MKSRILFCDYWEDPDVVVFSAEEKLVGVYLWTNTHINLIALYLISDQHICLETGVSQESLSSAKRKLEKIHRVHFCGNWVYLPNAQKSCGYTNQNHQGCVVKEIGKIPPAVLDHFRSLGYAIPYREPNDSPINNKEETNNNEQKDITSKSKPEGSGMMTTEETEEMIKELDNIK